MSAPYDWSLFNPTYVTANSQLTVDSSAGGVALGAGVNSAAGAVAIPGNAIGCLVTVETAPIRVTESAQTSQAPTTTFGDLFAAGDRFVIWGQKNLKNFRAIRTTGASATLDLAFLANK